MDDIDVAVGGEFEDVFSRESEARLCEQVLGDARHGLDRAGVRLRTGYAAHSVSTS